MKLFVKLLLALVVLAVLLPFTILKGNDGRPLMSFSDLKAPDLAMPDLPDSDKLPALNSAKREDIVYQWRDAKGQLNFTTSPPPEGVEYTAKGYDPNTNLIQSVEVEQEPPQDVETARTQIDAPVELGNPYSPERVEKLIKDAKNVQKLLDDRTKQQEAILGY